MQQCGLDSTGSQLPENPSELQTPRKNCVQISRSWLFLPHAQQQSACRTFFVLLGQFPPPAARSVPTARTATAAGSHRFCLHVSVFDQLSGLDLAP